MVIGLIFCIIFCTFIRLLLVGISMAKKPQKLVTRVEHLRLLECSPPREDYHGKLVSELVRLILSHSPPKTVME